MVRATDVDRGTHLQVATADPDGEHRRADREAGLLEHRTGGTQVVPEGVQHPVVRIEARRGQRFGESPGIGLVRLGFVQGPGGLEDPAGSLAVRQQPAEGRVGDLEFTQVVLGHHRQSGQSVADRQVGALQARIVEPSPEAVIAFRKGIDGAGDRLDEGLLVATQRHSHRFLLL